MTLTSAVAVLQGMPEASMFEGLFNQNIDSISASALELMKNVCQAAKVALAGLGKDAHAADLTLSVALAASVELASGRDRAAIEGLCEDASLAYAGLVEESKSLAGRLSAALQ